MWLETVTSGGVPDFSGKTELQTCGGSQGEGCFLKVWFLARCGEKSSWGKLRRSGTTMKLWTAKSCLGKLDVSRRVERSSRGAFASLICRNDSRWKNPLWFWQNDLNPSLQRKGYPSSFARLIALQRLLFIGQIEGNLRRHFINHSIIHSPPPPGTAVTSCVSIAVHGEIRAVVLK